MGRDELHIELKCAKCGSVLEFQGETPEHSITGTYVRIEYKVKPCWKCATLPNLLKSRIQGAIDSTLAKFNVEESTTGEQ